METLEQIPKELECYHELSLILKANLPAPTGEYAIITTVIRYYFKGVSKSFIIESLNQLINE